VTTLLVVLIVALGGAAFASWQWVQGKYYIGPENGEVAIFQGVNSSIAGMSLSSPYQTTGVPVAELRPGEQTAIHATVSYGGLTQAQQIVTRLRTEVSTCRAAWDKLVSWQQQSVAYQAAVLSYQRALNAYNHTNPRPRTRPAAPPPLAPSPAAPTSSTCAPAAAFTIAAGSLPPGTTNTGATAPASTPSTTPAATPAATAAHSTAAPTHTAKP
jgi:protein phosphatase